MRTILLDPVYITLTRRKLIGNHFFASCISNSRNEMIPAFFTDNTQRTQTVDWIVKSRKFMEKSFPDTTNCKQFSGSVKMIIMLSSAPTLLTSVIRIEARQ